MITAVIVLVKIPAHKQCSFQCAILILFVC